MEAPVLVTLQTLDRAAARLLASPETAVDSPEDRKLVERFLMRTGRPLPKVLVIGGDLALWSRQIDELGGAALGVDAGEHVIALANRRYPGGHFVQGDPCNPPVGGNLFDAGWAGAMPSHFPRADVVAGLGGLHRALRPGGLLYVRLKLGDEEGFINTPDGRVYHACWDEQQFAQALSVLDFDGIDRQELGAGEVGLTFRREY